ncbi:MULTISPECIES: glycogen debranching protein [Arthrobacter]|uniref:Glycogen debranching protein n=1 Tax=Arthrobacter terricola TaxID=2547396 RepID=A0A4R5KNE9_9MICC|nr:MULTISPECIES: glycogen debranching protein [Arthrobacter]MBT8161291.1 glycogen debranching protein [Arthrobacter sp. GN70]TDF96110.1 glycogen debranching protein [Arthrobacter terricola]
MTCTRQASDEQIRQAAVKVLRLNDLGTMTTAAPNLYPHMWSWDAAFVTIGLSRVSVPRAIQELRTLLSAQWSTGMIPHIVFSDNATGYFPGPERWGTDSVAARPAGVRTSGICQPPVHAIALRHVVDRGRENGGSDQSAAEAFLEESFEQWMAWHRWLVDARDPDGTGLIEIHHGWESGFDNSPRWDAAYGRVRPGRVEPFTRRDTLHVADAAQRPDDAEYTKYLWLVQQMESVGYDDKLVPGLVDFRVRDVFFSAILAASSDGLAGLAEEIGHSTEAAELRRIASRFQNGVAATVDPVTGLARDYDVRAGEWISTRTVSGFAPLISGGEKALLEAQRDLLRGPEWMGYRGLAFALPPSTSPGSPAFKPRTYWRGPVWPFLNLLLGWASRRNGQEELCGELREASLCQLSDLAFGEYYEPFTGEPLGSLAQSWTAAAALEWLA